jgi:AraC family transcriptional regulator
MITTLKPHTPGALREQALRGNCSYVLSEQACEYFWEGSEALSIKTFSNGQSLYSVGRGYYAVDENSYLLLNHGQPYSITISSDRPVTSFCLFFAPGLVRDVWLGLTSRQECLIDEPFSQTRVVSLFYERTYPHDSLVTPALLALKIALEHGRYESGRLEEHFHEILVHLFQMHQQVHYEVEALPALRAATRAEIYRRLYRAKDYVTALFSLPLTLADMAYVACLSPNHFLRLFKIVFHQTPHQYLINIRLAHAQRLLIETEEPVTDICFAVGFESLSSFSWLFKQRFGCSPLAYRHQKK